MRTFSVGFLLGTVLFFYYSVFATGWYVLLGLPLGVAAAGCIFKRYYTGLKFIIIFALSILCSISYTNIHTHHLFEQQLPQAWERQDILVEGKIISLPQHQAGGSRFIFRVDTAQPLDQHLPAYPWQANVKLAWYRDAPPLRAGERWRLVVRMKRPHGFYNQGGLDYEKWLFSQRIMATGYVRQSKKYQSQHQRLHAASLVAVNPWRERIRDQLAIQFPDSKVLGMLQGLVVAERALINPAQWEVLRKTGTNHLLAISGLHITLVAALGVLPVWLLIRAAPGLLQYVPKQWLLAGFGALFALVYALLAGLTIPTQRALLMSWVLLLALLIWRRVSASTLLAWVLLLVVLRDPLAVLSAGFYLSFFAVATLLWLARQWQQRGYQQVIRIQLALSFALMPLTALLFNQVAWLSPLANLVAIPWVSILVIPCLLLGIVLWPIAPPIALWCWQEAEQALQALWVFLHWLVSMPGSDWVLAEAPWGYYALALLGVVLWLLPAGVPGRYWGALLCVPLLSYQPPTPNKGDFMLSVLDVGQGSAAVIRTQQHTLLLDTGARFSASSDVGRLVIVPWLQAQGIRELDKLIVSHDDSDHSGGVASVLKVVPTQELLFNERDSVAGQATQACLAGMHWDWDGVEFTILHPETAAQYAQDNNNSCILRVSNKRGSVLFMGDAERLVEKRLLQRYTAAQLKSQVLVVGHHGSKTSSSEMFVQAVSPEWGIVSAGYLNRYRHPAKTVLKRFQRLRIPVLQTADTGEVRFHFRHADPAPTVILWRHYRSKFWHRGQNER